MDKKCECPISLAYCIDMTMAADSYSASCLAIDLDEYFEDKKHNGGFDIHAFTNNGRIIITIRGNIPVEYTLVDTSSASYHYEIDGESSFDCMAEEDFRQIIINAFRKCATNILSTEILEKDGSTRKMYMAEDIEDYLSWNEDVGYPSDNEIWDLLEFHELVA